MWREAATPRPDYGSRLEAQGLSFHDRDGYWREDACYRFTLAEVEIIEAATAELHALCIQAARHLIDSGGLARLAIPEACWEAIGASLDRNDFTLYGRFDLAYDGRSPPKLLEYNADTPTALLESAVCQWYWLQDCFPRCDQFNSLHEKLVARWKRLPGLGVVHVACLMDEEEDWACATYLLDTLIQAGRRGVQIAIQDIGWDDARSSFVDLDNRPIGTLFKLYPWEWMLREEFGTHVPRAQTLFVEPLWKSVLSCKGLLPVLWELNPGHPNLLPAYFEAGRLAAYARKPLYSREGANITLVSTGTVPLATGGGYGEEGFIYQELAPVPVFDGLHAVIGSWVVDGEPAGMCLREDRSPVTGNTSHFVPHYFT